MPLQGRAPNKYLFTRWSSEKLFSKKERHELLMSIFYLIIAPKLETDKKPRGHCDCECHKSHHHTQKKPTPALKGKRGAEPKHYHPVHIAAEKKPTKALDSKKTDGLINSLVDLLNSTRKSHGLKALTLDPTLNHVAKIHATDIAKTGNVSHTGSDGSTLRQRMERERCIFESASEFVLAGQKTPADVQSFLSNPSSLKKKLLCSEASQAGVHVCTGVDGRLYWTIICSVPRSLTRLEVCQETATEEFGVLEFSESVLLEWRNELLSLINKTRAKHGLHPVRMSRTLNSVAKLHAQDQARAGRISHYGTDGSDPCRRVLRQGYEYSYVSENVASGQESPSHVHDAFMNSPGHAKNVLSPRPVEVGLHVCLTSGGRLYWTENFGKRRRSRTNA